MGSLTDSYDRNYLYFNHLLRKLAEREGFEPSVRITAQRLSRPLNSDRDWWQGQFSVVAGPRNQSSNLLSQLEPGTFLNKSHPRNHRQLTPRSLGFGAFLLAAGVVAKG